MFSWFKKVMRDHRAMNIIREGKGDVHLVAFVTTKQHGWDCRLFQSDNEVSGPDPAEAIINAKEKFSPLTVNREPSHQP
jgi:hypothetical protein